MTNEQIAAVLAQLGPALGPDVVARCRALYAPQQEPLASSLPAVATDCAYGTDPRHRLDLYRDPDSDAGRLPVLLFVHGGGFVQGSKGGVGEDWPNAHVGRWAAANGMLGAVMNYRLAPHHMWPAGSEDVGAAVDWLRDNAAARGGDPDRIVVLGTSAGAIHIAGYLRLRPDHRREIRAAAMLSGLYGFTPLDPRDEHYYGPQADYGQRAPLDAVAETTLPVFLACARFDPPRFQAEWTGMMQARLQRHGALPWVHFANAHNHYSMAMHLGSADHALSDALLGFLTAHI